MTIEDEYSYPAIPEYPLDADGIPKFLEGMDRLIWKGRENSGRKQYRYSAEPPHVSWVNRFTTKTEGNREYVYYTYQAGGMQWYECVWEEI